jgi:hypothetical protein
VGKWGAVQVPKVELTFSYVETKRREQLNHKNHSSAEINHQSINEQSTKNVIPTQLLLKAIDIQWEFNGKDTKGFEDVFKWMTTVLCEWIVGDLLAKGNEESRYLQIPLELS